MLLKRYLPVWLIMVTLTIGCLSVSGEETNAFDPYKAAQKLRTVILKKDAAGLMSLYCGLDQYRASWLKAFQEGYLTDTTILQNSPNIRIYFIERPEAKTSPAVGDHVVVLYYPPSYRNVNLETETGGIPESVIGEVGKAVLKTNIVMGRNGWCWDELFNVGYESHD